MSLTTPADARILEAKAMTEREFQKQVIEIAHTCGWLVAHFRPGKTSRVDRRGKEVWVTPMQGDPGFPDLVLCRPPRLIFAELKREGAKPTALQTVWLKSLLKCSLPHFESVKNLMPEVQCWRPSDWEIIVEVLR